MGYIHGRRGGDVHRGDVDGPGDGDRVLEADGRRDVDRVGANVHLRRYGDGVVVVGVAPVHRRGVGGRDGHGCSRGGVADFIAFVTRVKVGLSMSLQMTGDVGCTEHLPTDATGDLAFVPDHVGTESVFGGESRGTSRYLAFKWSF